MLDTPEVATIVGLNLEIGQRFSLFENAKKDPETGLSYKKMVLKLDKLSGIEVPIELRSVFLDDQYIADIQNRIYPTIGATPLQSLSSQPTGETDRTSIIAIVRPTVDFQEEYGISFNDGLGNLRFSVDFPFSSDAGQEDARLRQSVQNDTQAAEFLDSIKKTFGYVAFPEILERKPNEVVFRTFIPHESGPIEAGVFSLPAPNQDSRQLSQLEGTFSAVRPIG